MERNTQIYCFRLLLILNPFAPHIAEELWFKLGNNESMGYVKWPTLMKIILKKTIMFPVQVNGECEQYLCTCREKEICA